MMFFIFLEEIDYFCLFHGFPDHAVIFNKSINHSNLSPKTASPLAACNFPLFRQKARDRSIEPANKSASQGATPV
jgi:hypothetical protein